ncbi:MAG TPA: single-stranded DNA-binding protein [Ignavibacteria bacterium]|nr:single-stranded DNA-binding protein [Ignavibacteria bacterium]
MRGLNKVTLIGNIQPNDPELKYIPNGTAVCKFKFVTSESYKDSSGNIVEKAEWHRMVVWGKLGETCATYLKKGSRVYFEGKIRTPDTYEKDGKTVYPHPEIIVDTMLMLDSKSFANSDNVTSENGKQVEKVSEAPDSDLPF